MSESMFQSFTQTGPGGTGVINSGIATYQKLSPDILAAGIDLSDQVLNQAIINAGSKRASMKFVSADSSQVSVTKYAFTLNPQTVKRSTKAVEAEFPTMAAWHTYRWMIEPPIWEISGYAGFAGQTLLQSIVDLDGQDNIFWQYPYLFPNPRQVKVISSVAQYAVPYTVNYQIVLRELPVVVRNYWTTDNPANRITSPFVSPSTDVTGSISAIDSWDITDQEKTLTAVATDILNKKKSTLNRDQLLQDINNSNPGINQLSSSWSTRYPQVNGQDLISISFHTRS